MYVTDVIIEHRSVGFTQNMVTFIIKSQEIWLLSFCGTYRWDSKVSTMRSQLFENHLFVRHHTEFAITFDTSGSPLMWNWTNSIVICVRVIRGRSSKCEQTFWLNTLAQLKIPHWLLWCPILIIYLWINYDNLN